MTEEHPGETAQEPGKTRPGDRTMLITFILLAANLRGCITGVGSLVPLIRADLGLSNAAAGFITTLPLLVFALISFLAADVARRLGPGRTLSGAFWIVLAGEIVRSYAGTAGLFLGTALLAVGIGLCNVLLVTMIKQRFSHRLGFATSIYSTAMASAASLSVGVSVPVATGLGLGWRNALGMWILLAVPSVVLWSISLRRDPVLSALPPAAEHASQKQPYARMVYRLPIAWCFAAFYGVQTLLFYGTSAWIPSILQSKGYTLEQAAAVALYMQVMNLPSTFLVPLLCSRRRDQRPFILLFGSLLVLGMLLLCFAQSLFMILLSIGLFALGLGSALSFSNTFFAVRTENVQQSAALSGMTQTVGYLLASFAPTLVGYLFDVTGSWTLPLVFFLLVSLGFFFFGLPIAKDRLFFPPLEKE